MDFLLDRQDVILKTCRITPRQDLFSNDCDTLREMIAATEETLFEGGYLKLERCEICCRLL